MVRLFDSELKIMELIWAFQPISAKQLSLEAAKSLGWNKNTTYTVLKKLVEKGAVLRTDPGFLCTALLGKKEVQKEETHTLIQKLYGGSKKAFFSAFVEESLSPEEKKELMDLLEGKR